MEKYFFWKIWLAMEKSIVNEKSIQSCWNHFVGKSDSADWETMEHPQETMALFIAKAVLVVVQIFPYQASSRIMPKTLQKWWNHNSYDCITWQSVVSDFTSSYDFDVIALSYPILETYHHGGIRTINSYFRVPTNNHNHIGVFFIYPLVNIQKTMENRHFWMAILQLFLWPFSSSQTLPKQIIPWTSPFLLVQSPLPSGNLT